MNLTDDMKAIKCLSLLVFVLVTSCQNVEEIEEPKNLLSKSEMKDLVYDMVLLDAAAVVNKEKLNELNIEILQFLSQKYGIDSTDLKQNILYYNLRFDENSEIFEQAKDSIKRLDRVYDSISKIRDSLRRLEKKRKDSIIKIEALPESKRVLKYKVKDSVKK